MLLRSFSISSRSAIVLLGLILVPPIIYLSKPYPTEPLRLAIGQKGTSYEYMGHKIAEYFKAHGLDIELVSTHGMDEGISKLDDDHASINAAFMTAGKPPPIAWSGLSSLGSVQYSPLWLIYQGVPPSNGRELLTKRIAIGNDGTNTQSLFMILAKARGINVDSQSNFIKTTHADAVTMLDNDELDAVFIADGLDSENVQRLLKNPKNKIISFDLADAYTRQIPYLNKLVVPRGSIDLVNIRPEEDKTILATTTTLLVENELHPLIQWMLLRAIREIHNEGSHFFAPTDFFPARLDNTTDLSPIAVRFYGHGFPALTEYMPWWLAIYLDRIWVILLTVVAIVVPLKEIWSAIRDLRTKGD